MRSRTSGCPAFGILFIGVVVLAGFGIAAPAAAQSTLDFPVGELKPYSLDSGDQGNPARGSAVVYGATVTVKDAVWVRLYFGEVELESGSTIRMTSAYDNEVQELDAAGIAMWNGTSAYFNGDTVYLELIAGPHTSKNRVVLDEVAVQVVSGGLRVLCGICGLDDRIQSDEEWSGRIMSAGCTGSVYNENSCVVSAGHCVGSDDVIQFNVPNSTGGGSPQNPPVADQFPITDRLYENNGVGADWAAMTTGLNNLGQTIYERYGEYRPIASAPAPVGYTATVWGYGVDEDTPTHSQTQQTDSGPINNRYSNYYTFTLDSTYGNSGSGLLHNNQIVGIVTHCSDGCPNFATRVDLDDFTAARIELCGTAENDYCEDAPRVCPGTRTGSTVWANSDGSASCGSSSNSPDVWYEYTPNTSGTVTVDTCADNNYDGVVSVHTGCPGTSSNQVGCDDDGCGPTGGSSTVTFSATGQQTYLIRVSGYDGDSGDFTLTVAGPDCAMETDPPTPDPSSFLYPPMAFSHERVSMTATMTTDVDSPPVEYYFEFVSGDPNGDSSGWQTSRSHTDYDLSGNTEHSYRTKCRDSEAVPNETGWSSVHSVITDIETPTVIEPGTVTATSIEVIVTSPLTNLDVGTSGLYFDSTYPGGDSGLDEWIQTTSDTATGLSPDTLYSFRAQARNQDGEVTDWGPTFYVRTLECDSGADCSDGVFCNGEELCVDGSCEPGVELDCNDDVSCTIDSCNEEMDVCDNVPTDAMCDNDLFCDGVETCDVELGCLSGEYPCEPEETCDEVGDVCVGGSTGDGDFDEDGDVDLDDFAVFQVCFPAGTVSSECEPGDMDGSGEVDLDDYTLFVAEMSGPQ